MCEWVIVISHGSCEAPGKSTASLGQKKLRIIVNLEHNVIKMISQTKDVKWTELKISEGFEYEGLNSKFSKLCSIPIYLISA